MFRRRLQAAVLVSGMALPMMMGQGCPVTDPAPVPPGQDTVVQPAQPTTLLTNTTASIGFGIPRFTGFTFNPTSAGKVVTVSISGNVTGSRPAVRVFDNLGNIVIDELSPTTNTTTASFVSTTTGEHRIFAFEFGAPASLYNITAIQQP